MHRLPILLVLGADLVRACSATHFKLLNQRRRYLPERGGHDDGVKRTAFGPATIAVAKPDAHIVIREVSECFRGGLGQWRDNLDGADLSRQVRKDGGLIARTCADFEHNMIGRDLGQLRHQGHDERLRYGLAVADRNRAVRVCDGARSLRDEQMAFRLPHGLKDPLRQALLSRRLAGLAMPAAMAGAVIAGAEPRARSASTPGRWRLSGPACATSGAENSRFRAGTVRSR